MKKPAAWRRYLRFWGANPARDLDDELRFHVESRYDEFVRDGLDPAAARAAVEQRFGNMRVVRDKCSAIDARWERERTLMDLLQVAASDFRFALRQLRRSPALSIAAILCFALGIGANTSIFSVVDAVLFRPLPFPQSDQLVLVGEELPNFGGGNFGLISTAEFADYQRLDGGVFESTAIFEGTSFTLAGGSADAERVSGAAVSASLFKVLRAGAARGRVFLPGDDKVGSPNAAVISDALWRRRFNADPNIVGRTALVNGVSTTIIGVLAPGFAFPLPGLGSTPADVFSPYWITPEIEKLRGNAYNTSLIARLSPGKTLADARSNVSTIAAGLRQWHPNAYGPRHTTLADAFWLRDRAVGEVRTSLLVLLTAVGLVLLIASINVSSLLLARTAARAREISVRRALGASRGRLASQFLAESAVLVAIGALLGLAVASWGAKLITTYAPQSVLQGYAVSIDARVLLVSLGVAALCAVGVSLVPALQRPETTMARSLREDGRSASAGMARQNGRRTLVVSQIALAVVVAAGAGLMVKSLRNAQNVDPGFDPRGVVTFRLGLLNYRYAGARDVLRFEQEMIDRLRALPGVRSASVGSYVPLSGLSRISFSLDGKEFEKVPSASNTIVFPDYFETVGISMRAGRAFAAQDAENAQPVSIVNEALARQFFPNGDAIGQRLKWGSPTSPSRWTTIVGVASTVKMRGLDAPDEPAVYFPAAQTDTSIVSRALRGMSYIVRTDGAPAALFNVIRRTVKEADPELPIIGLATLEDITARSVATRRFNTAMLGTFAGLALALAAIGIYGLMAYSVVQRTREIGIRLAIGASPGDVLALVVKQAAGFAAVGIALGLIGAAGLTRLMESILFNVSPLDPLTFAGSALLLFAIAGLASYLPARRAARIDPQLAIRAD
jgi:predicted permease